MHGAHKLSALDASFLHLETPDTHMHIGGVAIFEPSPLGSGRELFKELLAAIEPRLDLVPRYRQRLAFVPLSLDVPVWVDDVDFKIRNHVKRAALPKPGGDHELQEFIAQTFSRQLDRRRPLWELYVVEGLKDGRWALVTKTHHSLVDGVSSLELATILLDTDPEPKAARPPSQWSAREAPTGAELLVSSLREQLARPAKLVNAARAVWKNPSQLATALRETASGLAVSAQSLRGGSSVLNGPIGPARVYTFSRFPLEDFKLIKNTFGATINDVVLAAVAGGLRDFLVTRGLDPTDPDQAIKALCPVSVRDQSQRSTLGNRLAAMLVELPVAEPDAAKRMQKTRATVDHLKARKQAVAADFLLNLAGFAPATILAMVARPSVRQIGFNLIVTNVPGPQFPLYCLGSRLAEAFPIAFVYENQHVAVAVFSYCGWLNFGYIGDALGMSDIDVFARCIETGLHELVDAAHAQTNATTPKRPAPRRRPSKP